MKLHKLFTIIAFSFLGISFFALQSSTQKSAGPPAQSTGGMGQASCVKCHGGSAVNSGPASIQLAIDTLTSGYELDKTYNVTFTLDKTDAENNGFQLAVRDSKGQYAGEFIVTDAVKTQLNTDAVPEAKHYIQHTKAGQLKTSEWKFQWKAPAADMGELTFYAAALGTNGDGRFSGDKTYVDSSLTLSSATGMSKAIHNVPEISIYPNPSKGKIQVQLSNFSGSISKVSVLDMTGKEVYKNSGKSLSHDLSALAKGQDTVRAISGGKVFTKKLVIE